MYYNILKKKLKIKKSVIGIVGLGYVGSELLKKFNQEGFRTVGLDLNINRIKNSLNLKNCILTNEYKYLKDVDVIIIALPTPLKKNLTPDLSSIELSLKKMSKYLKKGQLISLESSTYPGTTEEIIGTFLKNRKFKISKNFFLIYSPERISPEIKIKKTQRLKYNLYNTPKICAGYSKACLELGKILYKNVTTKVVTTPSLKSAETAKMVENIFRSVNIALVNELKMFLHKIKVDVNDVLNLAGTKPFGFTQFSPGPGFGGHCIPLDPFYLYWLAKKKNFDLRFIKTAGDINRKVTSWITTKIFNFLKKRKIKAKYKKVLLLGVAYKRNIDDTRESPGIIIAKKLKKKGVDFEYSDPHVSKIYFEKKMKKSVKINSNTFKKYPVIVIVTDHTKFNYNLISKKAKYIFDCRNVIKNRRLNYFKV